MNAETEALVRAINSLTRRIQNLEKNDIAPLGMIKISISGSQSIPVSIETSVVFTTLLSGEGFTWDAGLPSNIYPVQRNNLRVMVFGTVQFQTSSVGRRTVSIRAYQASGSTRWTKVVESRAAESTAPTVLSFAYPYNFDAIDDYFSILVYQSASGALNLESCEIGAMLLR